MDVTEIRDLKNILYQCPNFITFLNKFLLQENFRINIILVGTTILRAVLQSRRRIHNIHTFRCIFLTLIRQHGIPSLFLNSVHSVCGTESAKIPRNYTEFCVAEFRTVPQNSAYRKI
jgi:hypothetical protein